MYICLEIVVVGTGEKILHLDPEIHNYLKRHNILLEVQDTVSFVVQVHPTHGNSQEFEKTEKRLAFRLVFPQHFSFLPNFHWCFYNLVNHGTCFLFLKQFH